jgi:membrane-bound lytic murein transglycosylase D
MSRRSGRPQGVAWVVCATLLGGSAEGTEPSAPSAAATAKPALTALMPATAPKSSVSLKKPPLLKVPAKLGRPSTSTKLSARASGVGPADPVARRQIAGGPTVDDVALGAETPELRALHDAERELFPPAMPALGAAWPDQLAAPLSESDNAPRVHASGLPPSPPSSQPPVAEGGKDLSWLGHLEMPDIPVRWDARVIRYLEFYKDDPRGRQLLSYWLRRGGRYRESIRRSLRKKALPEDLSWIAMVESGYDPTARSPAGALGLWQFMPDTARLYGLGVDRWADQRLNVQAETDAAAEFMSDLYRRFGSWELAVASYNMGYAGMMALVHRYNTNDYWALSKFEGALPWETTLYVPKLVAIAIVGRNLATFGYADDAPESPTETDEIRVAPGTRLAAVAQAAGCTTKEIEALNLELRASRTPPAPVDVSPSEAESTMYPVRVPLGKGAVVAANLARLKGTEPPLERYVVKFGESVDQIAATRRVPLPRIVDLNGIAPGEVIRGGTVLLVPRGSAVATGAAVASGDPSAATSGGAQGAGKPVVMVPADLFVYPDRHRIFYRVIVGDTAREIADAFHVSVDDLRRWNDLDPSARLQEGMTLQVFVPSGVDLSRIAVIAENDARVVPVGSEEFFAYWEGVKGKRRIVVSSKAGDTLEAIGKRYNVTASTMERINRRNRNEVLKEGESVVVYLPPPPGAVASGPKATASMDGALPAAPHGGLQPVPNGPLPEAPNPMGLPPLP